MNVNSLWLFLSLTVLSCKEIRLSTKLGHINGKLINTKFGTEIYQFIGIKYGEPPIDSMRFKPSTLNTEWLNNTYNFTQYGPACLQMPSQPDISYIDEDCLYLNIYTPNTDNISNTSNLPVMLWIHGGGFVVGSGSQLIFHGDNFVGSPNGGNNFIYISINYRLGPFGFLSSEQIYSDSETYGGMNGLSDQITALKWVKKYISLFGGNPNNITIFGQSAGGMSICMLLVSELCKNNLFQQVIESGSCNGIWGQPNSLDLGLNFSKAMIINAGYPNNITYLRSINNGTDLFWKLSTSNAPGYNTWWRPAIDMYIINDFPSNIYSNDMSNIVLNANKGIFGVTSMDADGYNRYGPNTTDEYKQLLSMYLTNETQINLLYNYYYPVNMFASYINISNASYAWFTINADTCTTCETMNLCMDVITSKNNFECYYYIFAGTQYPNYAPHASELPFIFDHKNETQGPTNYYVAWNQTVSNIMLNSWTNFCKYGSPNINTQNVKLQWLSFNNQQYGIMFDDSYMTIKHFPRNYRNNVCAFWTKEIGFDIMSSFCKNTKRLNQK